MVRIAHQFLVRKKIPIAPRHYATVWVAHTALNFLITPNFCAAVWAGDHSGTRLYCLVEKKTVDVIVRDPLIDSLHCKP